MLPAWQEYYQQQPELLSSPLLFLISGLSTESVNSWKFDVIHKINSVLKKRVWSLILSKLPIRCYINEWVKAATVHCGDKTFTSDASKDTAFLRLIHGWKKLNISNIWLQKKMTVCSILGEKLHSSWLQTFCNSIKAATAKRFFLPDILGQHAAV